MFYSNKMLRYYNGIYQIKKGKENRKFTFACRKVRLLIFLHDVFLVKLYFLEVFLGELVYFLEF